AGQIGEVLRDVDPTVQALVALDLGRAAFRARPGGHLRAGEGSAQVRGDLLGWRLIDEDAADRIAALRMDNDLDVPVVIVADRGPVALEDARAEIGRRVQPQLVAGIAEVARERAEVARDQARKVAAGLGRERVLEGAAVLARQDPGLERRARGVRHERGEGRRQLRHALLGGDLLTDYVAVETAALLLVVLARLVQLALGLVAHDGHR